MSSGTLPTGEMEEPSRRCGTFWWKWSSGLGPGPNEGLRACELPLWSGPGRRTSAFQGRFCECCAATLSTRGVCSSKDVRRSRSRPSRLFCQGQSGVACFTHCSAGCVERGRKNLPFFEAEGFLWMTTRPW